VQCGLAIVLKNVCCQKIKKYQVGFLFFYKGFSILCLSFLFSALGGNVQLFTVVVLECFCEAVGEAYPKTH
jgi:hypothetical protein